MTTVVHETAFQVTASYSEDTMTARRVLAGLLRSVAAEVVNDALYEDLEAVLGEYAVRLPPESQEPITARLRTATSEVVGVVPRLVSAYSDESAVVDQMAFAVVLSAEQPALGSEYGYLVRLASAVLTLLDLMGEVAEA